MTIRGRSKTGVNIVRIHEIIHNCLYENQHCTTNICQFKKWERNPCSLGGDGEGSVNSEGYLGICSPCVFDTWLPDVLLSLSWIYLLGITHCSSFFMMQTEPLILGTL